MKMNSHFYRLIMVILIVTLIPVYSCHLFFDPFAPEKIKITGIDANGDPELKDEKGKPAKIFKAKAGTTINWRLNTPDIKSIDSIYRKDSSANIFVEEPSRVGNSQNWTATIKDSAKSNQYEDYNINWTDKNGVKHPYDPRIQLR